MIQDSKQAPSPIGVVYNTRMSQPGAALALAALHVLASRREARVDGVCVTGAGLDAAIFCDVIGRFYSGQTRTPSSNNVLPIGFAPDPPLPNPAMVETAIGRRTGDGGFTYARSVQRVTDTATPDAMLRNAITFTPEAVVILSAPATWLARSLALAGVADLYRQRVKRVVIVDAGGATEDQAALSRLTSMLPVPVVRCPIDVGRTLSVPSADLVPRFWTPGHPVVDALQAAGTSTVPLDDLAAAYYAVNPDSEFFTVTGGTLAVNPSHRAECLTALTALATSRPAPPPQRGR
jgi:hypothetical protein